MHGTRLFKWTTAAALRRICSTRGRQWPADEDSAATTSGQAEQSKQDRRADSEHLLAPATRTSAWNERMKLKKKKKKRKTKKSEPLHPSKTSIKNSQTCFP
jgi:hypothetical protein